MTTINQTVYIKDKTNKKISVTREFAAPVKQVWAAWTQQELLDQWWAPKPYKAETKSLDFKEGGFWLYAMVGPDAKKMWARMDYKSIAAPRNFTAKDSFCDEKGQRDTNWPQMEWKNNFEPSAEGTKVVVEIQFASEKDMQKILETGFEEGFEAAHRNLDELLDK